MVPITVGTVQVPGTTVQVQVQVLLVLRLASRITGSDSYVSQTSANDIRHSQRRQRPMDAIFLDLFRDAISARSFAHLHLQSPLTTTTK